MDGWMDLEGYLNARSWCQSLNRCIAGTVTDNPINIVNFFRLNRPCSIDWERFGDAMMKYKEVSVLRYYGMKSEQEKYGKKGNG